MHTVKRVYENLLNKGRIIELIELAAKHKKHRQEVQTVLNNIDEYADKILVMLKAGDFKLSPQWHKTIIEKGKKRELTISPFYPNRILDYIIVETLKPYIRKSMYEYCIGNVDKRGLDYGIKVIKRTYKQYKYYLQLDIRKFYPSVKSETMIAFMKTKIKDQRFMKMCEAVVLRCPDLPIGSYYSQWFSNWILQDLDHYVKEKLRVPFYVRYVDDMLLMGNNKRKLLNAMYEINKYLEGKGLSLKKLVQVKQWKVAPIDFLGFRFGQNVKIRSQAFKKLRRLLSKLNAKKHISVSQARSLTSYLGWIKYASHSYTIYNDRVKPVVAKKVLKKIISDYDRRHNYG